MAKRKISQLAPGSIIIEHFGGLTNLTSWGQKMVKIYTKDARAGSTKATHATLVLKEHIFAHAHPRGIEKNYLTMMMDEDLDHLSVYECTATLFSAYVAKIAEKWIINRESPKDYKQRKAVRTIFGTHTYGSKAKKRAKLYHDHALTIGGPPGLHSKPKEEYKKRMICSTFVIACWQAAIGPTQASKYMALDANHTSPMTLEGYLRNNNNWKEYGIKPN